jgi:hypothetical protein
MDTFNCADPAASGTQIMRSLDVSIQVPADWQAGVFLWRVFGTVMASTSPLWSLVAHSLQVPAAGREGGGWGLLWPRLALIMRPDRQGPFRG